MPHTLISSWINRFDSHTQPKNTRKKTHRHIICAVPKTCVHYIWQSEKYFRKSSRVMVGEVSTYGIVFELIWICRYFIVLSWRSIVLRSFFLLWSCSYFLHLIRQFTLSSICIRRMRITRNLPSSRLLFKIFTLNWIDFLLIHQAGSKTRVPSNAYIVATTMFALYIYIWTHRIERAV